MINAPGEAAPPAALNTSLANPKAPPVEVTVDSVASQSREQLSKRVRLVSNNSIADSPETTDPSSQSTVESPVYVIPMRR